jgi:hypothetical protein
VWFAYAIGPLGTYVRVRWSYVVDLSVCEESLGVESVRTIQVSNVEDLMVISSVDPDLVDVVKSSSRKAVCIVHYGR